MANIKQYEIIKDIQTGGDLTVHFVENKETTETGILRLMNYVEYRDSWNELYRKYGTTITNYKYLPALKQIDILDDKPFVVMEGIEGSLLEKGQILIGRQIDQLIEAIVHLHHHKIYFGKITRFNIWIKESGDIRLYGAGERSVFHPEKKMTIQEEIKSVLTILKNHSEIPADYFDGLSFDSIEELKEWVLSRLAIPKPGLVDNGESSKTVFGEQVKESQEEENVAAPIPASGITKVVQNSGTLKKWFVGTAILMIILTLGWMWGGSKESSKEISKTDKKAVAVVTDKAADKKDPLNKKAHLSQFAPLFSGWVIIKQAPIKLSGTEYTLIATAQKRDESSGAVKIEVMSKGKTGEWTNVWESPEYKSSLTEIDSYIDSFFTITSNDGLLALLVFNLPDDGALGISEVKAISIQPNGSAKEEWSGYGKGVEQKNNVINVKGVPETKLSIINGKFTQEELPAS
ncbi:hypothetical protein [Neobacillus vireti]|uniref:hypothetical protein n=1 Tax=Neobacillus vireti TaxID=220686 RepID=UPI003000CC38